MVDIEISVVGDSYEEYYKNVEKEILCELFPNYPQIGIDRIALSFTISPRAKYADLLYNILDLLPQEIKYSKKNIIEIVTENEKSFLENAEKIYDLWTLARSWKSTKFTVNNKEIKSSVEFHYLVDGLSEKNRVEVRYYTKSLPQIKKQYNSHNHGRRIKHIDEQISLSKENPVESLDFLLAKYIGLYGNKREISKYLIDEYDRVIVMEDSYVVDFRIIPRYWARMEDDHYKDWDNPYIVIQELTHNNLFKFNFSDFRRKFLFCGIGIDYLPFHGLHYYTKEVDNYDKIDKCLPKLHLQERYDSYTGELHHFLIFRMESVDGKIEYSIGETKNKIHSYVLKVCKELEEKNSRSLLIYGVSSSGSGFFTGDFCKAFLSWEGKKKRWRLENKFSYYYEDILVKDDRELSKISARLYKQAIEGVYDKVDFGTYTKPINRWKSEELVYNIVKKLYKDYQVIYQYHPYYLSTKNGCMSYDVYICGLKVAIEYQGKQHFEAVDYFGGEENYKKQKERDILKAKRSQENGVKLIYVNYWESITPELISNKIDEALR